MSPRADDPPRRGTQPRRGASRDLPVEEPRRGARDGGETGIGRNAGAKSGTARSGAARSGAARSGAARPGTAKPSADKPATQQSSAGKQSAADPGTGKRGARRQGTDKRDAGRQPDGAADGSTPERGAADRGRGGIGAARAYTPRGRTMAERDQRTRSPRAGRTTDPFRPALQVLDGGRPAQRRGRPADPDPDPGTRERTRAKTRRTERADQDRTSRRRDPDFDDEFAEVGAEADEDGYTGRRGRLRVAGPWRTQRDPQPGRPGGRGQSASRTGKNQARRTVTGPRVNRSVRAVAAEPPRLANSTRRLRLGTVLALVLFVTIGVRIVVLQVASSPADAKKLMALRNSRLAYVKLIAPRGSILDRNGSVLAQSRVARFVAVDPELVKTRARAQEYAAKLAPLLAVQQSTLVPLMTPHKQPGGGAQRFEFLAHGVDITVGDQIRKMGLSGIVVRADERRDVPNNDLAANLIGFTSADNSGLEGLEARYDSLLHGTDGERTYEHGNGDLDKPIPGGYLKYDPPQPGSSLRLTIDAELQFEVQRILGDYSRLKKALIGGAIVIDVKTGEVLAQASYPAYDAANPLDYRQSDRQDVPSGIVADPGSVHKAFIFGAALEEGVITPDSALAIGPSITRGGTVFKDSHPEKAGTKMTMTGLLAHSSNVGTILIADKLGKDKVYEYQQKFGLGKRTNEGVNGEVPGRLLAPDEWSGSAYGSVPIGMSVDATLVQMAAGYAAIANDGQYIQPHLIQATISGKNGKVTPAPAPETHRVLRPEVAQELRTMMEGVITGEHATGSQAAVTGYRVAGKTGTGARLIDGQYTSYNYDTFIGMAPAENPRYVVAVSADVPHGTAGDVVAPAFSEMMQFTLMHNTVPPSTTKAPSLKLYP
jgi:cell division protein FtsI (penicillin-binding protein 3)